MKIIQNKIIPFGKNFLAINLFGVIFAKGYISPQTANHEYIHTLQQREMLFIFFYLWYVVEWVYKAFRYRGYEKGYFNISFEREAYTYGHDLSYPARRRHFAWTKFL